MGCRSGEDSGDFDRILTADVVLVLRNSSDAIWDLVEFCWKPGTSLAFGNPDKVKQLIDLLIEDVRLFCHIF